jgi:hypothetical protein
MPYASGGCKVLQEHILLAKLHGEPAGDTPTKKAREVGVNSPGLRLRSALIGFLCLVASSAFAAEYPAPKEGDWVAHNFKFHTGEVMPDLRLHYTTIGDPAGSPVLILHGTAGSGGSMLTPAFAGELFGAGQPLDAQKYFIILPDALGAGQSAKPSDGLRAAFPHYNYDDMVLGACPGNGCGDDIFRFAL